MKRSMAGQPGLSGLRIQLLGEFIAWSGEERISEEQWRSRRARFIVKLLALAPGHKLARDQVTETLWPEADFAASLNNFHQSLHAARAVVGADHLLLADGWLALLQCTVDVDVFETAAARAHASQSIADYQAALELYMGDLLPGDLYQDWTLQRRESLRQTYLGLLLELANLQEQRADCAAGIETLKKLLSCEPCHEEAHALLMRLYARNGQRRSALRQYDVLRDALRQELDVEPAENSTLLYKDIHSGAYAPILAQETSPCNLPGQLTSFIGREREIARLSSLLQPGNARLVTVTGAGGTGKTRLALKTAEALRACYPGGTWLVELAPLVDAELVSSAAVSALGLVQSPGSTPTQVLQAYLRSRQALLVLDNCEHLISAVAQLAEDLLRACPRIAILATSRELLGVGGEMVFRCPSLAVPINHLTPWKDQADCESLRLFAERAALASPGFRLEKDNVLMVAEVCRRLDGIPLAIEMAAARTHLLPISQIATRLDHAFQLLVQGSRTALPRQRTLKAAIDWSYDLLSDPERILLRRVSVFMGGWTLEAAEAVCAGEGLEMEQILDLTGRLVDKSMLLVESGQDGEGRYRMLEPIRQYAVEHLHAYCEETLLRGQHLAYFTALAEQGEPHLRAWGMVEWLDRFEVELANLRSALEWALSHALELGMRLSAALMYFWHIRGHREEGQAWLEQFLSVAETVMETQPPSPDGRAVFAKALFISTSLAGMKRDSSYAVRRMKHLRCRAIFEELGETCQKEVAACQWALARSTEDLQAALAACRKTGNDFYESQCLWLLTRSAFFDGDLPGSRKYRNEFLAKLRDRGDVDGEGAYFYLLQDVLSIEGQFLQAIESGKAAQQAFRVVGNREYIYMATVRMGWTEIRAGNYHQAIAYIEDALVHFRELNLQRGINESTEVLILAYWCLGELDLAEQCCAALLPFANPFIYIYYYLELLAISRGDPIRAVAGLRNYLDNFSKCGLYDQLMRIWALMLLALATQQHQPAAVLCGAKERILDACEGFIAFCSPAERAMGEQALANTRAHLGEERFQAEYARGKAMSLEQVEAVMRQVLDTFRS